MTVPRSHPRYLSLTTRDRLVEGWRKGLVATQGLIAHGRGEAFDYLIGERTTEEASEAIIAASCMLVQAERPVISVNGNVGALSANEIGSLSQSFGCMVEVNIFHRTEERIEALVSHLEECGVENVLGAEPDMRIPGLDHARALCCKEGIFEADVILVPLEDGDRCQALRAMGKEVITIDLNPLSRTSQAASITIVDNLIRAIPEIEKGIIEAGSMTEEERSKIIAGYDNRKTLDITLERISRGI